MVLREILIDQRGEPGADPASAPWRSIGYNLDGQCTTTTETASECRPASEGAPLQVDGNGGIDNTFGNSFFPVLALGAAGIDSELTDAQQRGVGALMLIIDDWNGGRDDSRVTVTVTQSVLGTPGMNGGGAPAIDVVGSEAFLSSDGVTPAPSPRWDGNDYFWGRSDTFIANDVNTPNVRVTTAYVTGGVLVARLPDRTPLRLLGSNLGLEMTLTDPIATGNIYDLFIAPQATPPQFIVGGRWGYNDILAQGPNVGVCIGTPLFRTLQTILGNMVDALQDPPSVADPSVPCDALSTAIRFDGYSGHFGGVATGQDIPSPCP
ncbi:MAG: hypothetical protein KC593_25235 [Myxococcales bacterium]|nr:hypothetical protein [Myxococcales bacterium]MCB9628724.1 hypothetical protein [Sandaracinaceae bacterium]